MTQSDVAALAGVSRRAISLIENGGGTVTALQAIADVVEFRLTGLPRGSTTGQRVRTARKARGISQAKLAEKSGLSVPTVRSIERDLGHVASLSAILTVLAPQARARKPEKANWEAGARDVRFTPEWLLEAITGALGPIDLDPCAAEGSYVQAGRYIHADENGLTSEWAGHLAFVNPPYSAAATWLERTYQAWANGEVETAIALVPVRTNTKVFHDRCAGVADIVFLRGRPNFVNPFAPEASGQVPFGTFLVIWGGNLQRVRELSSRLGGRLMERDRIAGCEVSALDPIRQRV